MRKEIERRPVDTKVLRETFRAALSRNMNKLMSEGYVPSGGVSTTVNSQAKPVLGVVTQEYTQVMVKYADFDVWIKESDQDHAAYQDANSSQALNAQLEEIKKGIAKDLKTIKSLEAKLADAQENSSSTKKSFLKRIKHSINSSLREKHEAQLHEAKTSLDTRKSGFNKVKGELDSIDKRLAEFYKENPSVTKDILLNSR